MVKGRNLLDYRNLFSSNGYEKNDKMISITIKMMKLYCIICGKYRKFKNPRASYILEKTVLIIICSKCKN